MTAKYKLVPNAKTSAKGSLKPVAYAKSNVKGSIEKTQRALNLIRRQSIAAANRALRFTNYGVNADIAKLLKSAVANAINNHNVSSERLGNMYVVRTWASKGLELRRFKAGPRGRARPIRKRYSQVFIELGIQEGEN